MSSYVDYEHIATHIIITLHNIHTRYLALVAGYQKLIAILVQRPDKVTVG